MKCSVLSIAASKCNDALFDESERAFQVSYHQIRPWIIEFVLNQSPLIGTMPAVFAEPLNSIRSGMGRWPWRKGFFCRCVDLVRSGAGFLSHGLNFFRCGQNLFRRGLNLFRDGPNLFVSDKTKSVVDQTFSASDKSFSAVDLTFSMTDQTFSSGRKLFPSRTKLIRSRTKVIRHRTKLSPSRTKPFASRTKLSPLRIKPFASRTKPFPSRTKPFPSRTKPFPSRTKPFPCLMKTHSLGFNLSESGVFMIPPVAAGASPWNERATIPRALQTTSSAEAATPPTPWQARLRSSTPFTLTGACLQTRQPKQHHG